MFPFLLPKLRFKEYHVSVESFLWPGNKCVLHQSQLCCAKEQGGLWLPDVERYQRSLSLVQRWKWNRASLKQPAWVKIEKEIWNEIRHGWSVWSKSEQIQHLPLDSNLDLLCVSEWWLHNQCPSAALNIDNIYRKIEEVLQREGVMASVKTTLKCQQIQRTNDKLLECLGLNISLSQQMYFVVVLIYNPHSFLRQLGKAIQATSLWQGNNHHGGLQHKLARNQLGKNWSKSQTNWILNKL